MSDKNKETVVNVNKSFEKGNSEDFLAHCADDISWTMVGEKSVIGISALREFMKQMDDMEPPQLIVESLIADSDSVACTGHMTMKDKVGKSKNYGFCDVYRFTGDKIQELTSFMVEKKDEGINSGIASA